MKHRFISLQTSWLEKLVLAEKNCFFEAGWSRKLITQAIADPNTHYWGIIRLNSDSSAPENADLLAYGAVRYLSGEAELLSLAVLPDYRGQGWGRKLLIGLEEKARQAGIHTMFLEVRQSNENAKKLYFDSGWEVLGKRKNYYRHPLEDALVLRHRLAAPSPGPIGQELG